jgi:RNA-directed DNA polymerase
METLREAYQMAKENGGAPGIDGLTFDNVQHHLVLKKVARRIQDGDVLHLLKLILKATGEQGVPQGGVTSPLISNVYLNEVDRMLEKAIEVTRYGKKKQFTVVQYARFADDMVILIHAHPWNDWLLGG